MNYYIISDCNGYTGPYLIVKTALKGKDAQGLVKRLWCDAEESRALLGLNKLDVFESLLEGAGIEVINNFDTINV